MAHDVYICYSSTDWEIANEMRDFLEYNNIDCLIAPRDARYSGRYAAEITDEIMNSEIFVIIMSLESQGNIYVHKELKTAFLSHKTIICFYLDDEYTLFEASLYAKNAYMMKNATNLYPDYNGLLEEIQNTLNHFRDDGLSEGVVKESEDIYIQEKPSIYVCQDSDDLIDLEIRRLEDDGYNITSQLNDSSAVIAYLTGKSVKSSKIKNDIETAFKMDRPVIPIYLERAEFGRIFKLKNRNKLKQAHENAIEKFSLDEDSYCEEYHGILKKHGIERDIDFKVESEGIEFDSSNKRNFRYLAELIKNSKDIVLYGDIVLEDDEIELFEDGIEIRGFDITINGNGHTIDARNKSRIFNVKADNVTFRDIRFINATCRDKGSAIAAISNELNVDDCKFQNNYGGAINLGNGKIEIVNCEFKTNKSEGFGAALIADECSVRIHDSLFSDNSARYGGAIRVNRSELKIYHCKFNNNSSEYGGAINFNEGEILIEDSFFNKNSSKENGGAIETQNGVLNIKNSMFKYNNAKFGGVVRNHSQTSISECKMSKNTSQHGGAIFNQKGSMDLTNNKFIRNTSPNEIIYNNDLVKLNNTVFKLNSAKNIISNINDANLSIYGGEFKRNAPEEYHVHNCGKSCSISRTFFAGERFARNESELTLDEPRFGLENKIILNKGSILIKGQNNAVEKAIANEGLIEYMVRKDDAYDFTYLNELIVTSKTGNVKLEHDIKLESYEKDFFEGGIVLDIDGLVIDGDNRTIDGSDKSRIFTITAKNITLKNIRFKNGRSHLNNYENPLNGNGGAIRNNSRASLKIINCEFENNTSEDKGGAIDNRMGEIFLSQSNLNANTSKYTGGAIINRKHGKMEIERSSFSKNSSDHQGGAIENEGEISLIKSLFESNSSKYGGSIQNFEGLIELYDSMFKNNNADNGGAIFNETHGIIDIADCLFEENNAESGGAIVHRGDGLSLKSTKFTENIASNEGGAIWKFSRYGIEIIDCEFSENKPDNIYDKTH